MEEISDIRIIGVDEKRPPRVRKEPYIDLFFKLSRQAPKEWCEAFNRLTAKHDPGITINRKEGLFIDTYVRDMNNIPSHLDEIKKKVAACNQQYIEAIRQRDLAAASKIGGLQGEGGQQGKLNTIVAALIFDV